MNNNESKGINIIKKLSILLLIVSVVFFTACNKKETENGKTSKEVMEYVYVPDFYEYDTGNEWINWVSSITACGNNIIVVADGYSGRPISSVCSVNMESGAASDFDLGVDKERYIVEITATENGYVMYSEDYCSEEEHSGCGNLPWKASYLTYYDSDFNIEKENDISEFVCCENGPSTFYYDFMSADAEGNVYFSYAGCIYEVDKNGRNTAKLYLNGINVLGMACVGDKEVLLYRNNGNEIEASLIDWNNNALGEALKNIPECGHSASIFAGKEDILYFAGDYSVFSYHTDSGQYEECLKWADCDMAYYNLKKFAAAGDSFICAEYEASGISLAVLNKVNKAEVKEKITLTVTMLEENSYILQEINQYNRRNHEYRLEARFYTNEYFPDEDTLNDAITRFNIDLISGNTGDIIIVTPELDYYNLASKGALADLGELIEKDEEIDESDFIDNIIDLLRVDGKIYGIAPDFCISTLVGKASNVGAGDSWNTEDIIELMEEHENSTLIYGINNINALRMFLMYSMDSYYDIYTGECSFDSEEFIRLLEVTAAFPEKTDEEFVFSRQDYIDDVRLLEQVYFSQFSDPQLFRALFKEEVNFIGYPAASGSGSVVSFGNELYAVSSQSEYKAAAWQFIRQYITEEYQNTLYSFPINRKVFENRIAEEMVKDTTNIRVSYNNFSIEPEPLSEADAECIRKLVYGATRSAAYDYEVMNIILEEAKKYYSGEKSADETARIIQSRVSVYAEEKR